MSVIAHEPRAGFRLPAAASLLALAGSALLWSGSALAVNVPVLYVSVNGAPEVSLENDQVCDGTPTVTCLGVSGVGSLLISSFELSADPGASLAGSFNLYNSSLSTISVQMTVQYAMAGSFNAPTLGLGTGLLNSVFGGGILNLQAEGFIDDLNASVLGITELEPGVPFSYCADLGVDPGCQDVVLQQAISQGGPPSLDVVSLIALRLSFDLTGDTQVSIGLMPGEDFGGGAYLSIVPTVVPVPAAAWLFLSGVGVLAGIRRRA